MNGLSTIGSVEIPAEQTAVEPTLNFIGSFADQLGIQSEKKSHLQSATREIISAVVQNNATSATKEKIGIDLKEGRGSLIVTVFNRGVPIFLENDEKKYSQVFHDAAKHLNKLSFENLGRKGQTVLLEINLGEEAAKKSLSINEGTALENQAPIPAKDFEIRALLPGEETALSQLFYCVYGYNYIHEFVYYPEKIRELRETKKLVSIVAVNSTGRLLGHVGLLQWSETPRVYEPCLGIVDPRVKAQKLFSKIFDQMMKTVQTLPVQYCFFDFVTNHDYTQRFVARYNPVDMALFIGCQSSETQAKLEKLGIGVDPKQTDRYSLLLSVIPQVKHPFGKSVALPINLGETLGFLLTPLNISWVPAPRFQMLPPDGECQTHLQPAQGAVIFDLIRPGRKALEKILQEWHQLLRNGYQYAAVDICLASPGIGQLYDVLAANGFFVAGFIPYHHSDKLGIRFQSIGPTKLDFNEVIVFSPTAKRLLEIIRNNYERNGLL